MNDQASLLIRYILSSFTSKSSPDCMNYLRQELDAVDQSLFELEHSLKHSDKDLMDLNTTKSALDHHKVNLLTNDVLS